MKEYELLDIATADMAFRARGKTMGEMFENAAKAVTSIMFEGEIAAKETREFTITATDTQALLQKFLSELLFLLETDFLVFSEFDVVTDGKTLKAKVRGEKYDPAKHKFIIDIKAITFHKMELKETKTGWECVVVVDV